MEQTADTESEAFSKHKVVPFYKLFEYADRLDYFLMILGSLGAIAHGFALPAFFLLFGNVINSFGSLTENPHQMYQEVSQDAVYLVYVGVGSMIASWAEVTSWMQTGERQATRLRIKYLEAMLNQDVGFFDTEVNTGDVMTRLSSDILLIQEAIGEKIGLFLHFVTTFSGGFILAFVSLWKLSLLTIGIIPVIATLGALYAHALTSLSAQSQEAYATAGIIAEQSISQVRIVYSFVGENKSVRMFSQALKSMLQLGQKAGLAKGLGVGSTHGVLFSCWGLLFWYGGILIRKGETDGGKIFTAILAAIMGGLSIGQAIPSIAVFSKARGAAYQLKYLINHKPKINAGKWKGEVLPVVHGDIVFNNVHFSYPSRPNVIVFKDLCLHIPGGKTVAIVGTSGSGKSTVVSLIERFYDPISGKVLLDNSDIRTLELDWLRRQTGLVNQEPALFATTIEKNILYGKHDATTDEIEAASKSANAHRFIIQLPKGYKTQVGERGIQLSGGEKQRIAIARAVLKNPSILLLDEATSALDAESERIVQDALDHLMIGRTTVIVAHRLSTIRNADIIVVLQQGIVVELGTHEELIAKGGHGVYNALVKLQMIQGALERKSARLSKEDSFCTGSCQFSFSRMSSSLSRQSIDHLEMGEFNNLQEDEKTSKAYFWRLLKMNAPEWPFFVAGTLGAMLAGITTPIFGYLIALNIDVFYDTDLHHVKKETTRNSIIFVLLGFVAFVTNCVNHYFSAIAGETLIKRVRVNMLAALLRNEIGWFDEEENNSGKLASQLSSGAMYARAAMGDRIATVAQNGAVLMSSIVIACIMEWRIALVVIATTPLLVAANIAEQMFLKGFTGDIDKAHHKATMVAGEALGNIRVVAAFNAESKVMQLFANELKTPKKTSFIRGQIAGAGFGISQCLVFCCYGVTLWYAAKLVKNGTTNFANVMKAFFVLIVAAFSVSETIMLAPDIVRSSHIMKSVFEILDRQTRIEPDSPSSEEVKEIKGNIEFRNVKFYYPTRPEVTVFNNLNLRLHSGKSLAIVGTSGAGKSTVIALVERFYDPVSGKILVDGKDIRTLNLKSYRRHVALVHQEPDGYNTSVGERGVQLSSGQKQRVAIARAVLKNPAILLLDEATSALDAESEHIVQEALDKLLKGRTTIMIAHRRKPRRRLLSAHQPSTGASFRTLNSK